MKKIINKLKNFHPCKPVMLFYLLTPIILSFFTSRIIDNDFWFLISTGKYILSHGFPTVEPFSIHHNFSFVVQQWLSDVIFYKIFTNFSYIGIFIMLVIATILIVYIIYKISILISENRVGLSVIVTFYISYLLMIFIRTRPQIFDFIILLTEIYILEKYKKDNNYKILLFLPVLSLLLINLHSSSWFMLFLFMLPYIVESFDFNFFFLKNKGSEKKYLLIIFILMFLVGFINPYGYKAITYIFTSYGNKYINRIVNEMRPLFIPKNLISILCYLTVIFIILTNILKRDKIKLRYLCLQLGTIILGLSSSKGFSFLLIGGVFPLAYYYKDKFKIYQENYYYDNKFKIHYCLLVLILISSSLIISFSMKDDLFSTLYVKDIVTYLNKHSKKEEVILYNNYDTGSYLIWNGYKVYLDPRAEIYLKSNNKKEDILKEYYNLQINVLDKEKFLKKYNFTYLIVNKNDMLFNYLNGNKNYRLLYKETTHKNDFYLFKKID